MVSSASTSSVGDRMPSDKFDGCTSSAWVVVWMQGKKATFRTWLGRRFVVGKNSTAGDGTLSDTCDACVVALVDTRWRGGVVKYLSRMVDALGLG